MNIKVLGPGCSRCFELERRARRAVEELGADVHLEKIADIQKIIAYRIMATPGLVIDGRVKSSGRVPSMDEIRTWIREAAQAAPAETE
jgi:small redox-active disulfide protein 2